MKTIKIVCLISVLLSFAMVSEFVPNALTHPSPLAGVFGYTDIGDAYEVDSGAGLLFQVRKSDGSITSILFNGTEYKSTTNRFSQIASGLGTPTTVTPETDGLTYVKIKLQTGPTNPVVADLTHYLIVRNGENIIYMATYPTAINSGGTLSGDGSVNRNVVMNSGSTLLPGGASNGSVLNAASLAWNANAVMAFELDTSASQLAITGALTKGGTGPHNFLFTVGPGIAIGNVYTLVTFASTDFTASDLTFSGLPSGLTGAFTVTGNAILFEIFGPPEIVTQPQSVSTLMGGTATFSVAVNPSPMLTYQWFKDDVAIAGATAPSLTINNVQGVDIGSYTVIVTNPAGSTTSNPASLSIAPIALVRHAPALNSSVVEGSVQQMLGENVTFNGSASVSGDLLVPGTPNVVLNKTPNYAGTIDGSGSSSPTNYTVTLNGGTSLGHVVRRTDPVALPIVTAPAPLSGNRTVTINNSSQTVGDWTTVRNLTLNSNAGQIAVPAGAYGDFSANSGSGFTLGVAGARVPSIYNFQSLALNGGAQVQVLGPVLLVVGNGFSINGGDIGNSANPAWLTLNVFAGGLTLNSGANVYGYVTVPVGTLTINGNTLIVGGAATNSLAIGNNGTLRLSPTGN